MNINNSSLAATPTPPTLSEDEIQQEWIGGDWFEKWQDATEDANESLMATLEALRGRVERTIRAALARAQVKA